MAERNRFVFFRYNKVGRSTQAAEGTIWFPRKESGSPRKTIYQNECPDELRLFETCLDEHNGSLSECSAQNAALEGCGNKAFKMINAMSEPYNFATGLKH
jgi:hypothetical protein